jgi:hypothetical protein
VPTKAKPSTPTASTTTEKLAQDDDEDPNFDEPFEDHRKKF